MQITNGRLSGAVFRPLGTQTEPTIDPEVLIFHTMVGYLKGTEGVFKSQGYTGDESTFGVGGPWDGASLDGVIWQWQDTRRQADAQFAGNAYADSVETSDGGDPNRPWSSKQLTALIDIAVAFCHAHPNRKPYLVNASGPLGDGAFGYHELRADWNTSRHRCPGAVREAQLRQIVIPKARAILLGQDPPHVTPPKPAPAHTDGGKIAVDGIFGTGTIGAIQYVLRTHRLYHDAIDGIFGPHTRTALQMYLKVAHDGVIGPKTVTALQHHVHALATGTWDKSTTRAIQTALNAGRF
jgi:peptidoglycan hydrolase-like protein with peptidoglycan-binding domain